VGYSWQGDAAGTGVVLRPLTFRRRLGPLPPGANRRSSPTHSAGSSRALNRPRRNMVLRLLTEHQDYVGRLGNPIRVTTLENPETKPIRSPP